MKYKIPKVLVILLIVAMAMIAIITLYKCNNQFTTGLTKLDNGKIYRGQPSKCITNFLSATISYFLIIFGVVVAFFGFLLQVLERNTSKDKDKSFNKEYYLDNIYNEYLPLIIWGFIFQFIGVVLQLIPIIWNFKY